MFDTLAVAQQFAADGVARDHARGHRQGDPRRPRARQTRRHPSVDRHRRRARTELVSLETRLIRGMVGTVIATATLTVGILRLLG